MVDVCGSFNAFFELLHAASSRFREQAVGYEPLEILRLNAYFICFEDGISEFCQLSEDVVSLRTFRLFEFDVLTDRCLQVGILYGCRNGDIVLCRL